MHTTRLLHRDFHHKLVLANVGRRNRGIKRTGQNDRAPIGHTDAGCLSMSFLITRIEHTPGEVDTYLWFVTLSAQTPRRGSHE